MDVVQPVDSVKQEDDGSVSFVWLNWCMVYLCPGITVRREDIIQIRTVYSVFAEGLNSKVKLSFILRVSYAMLDEERSLSMLWVSGAL